MNKKIIRIMVVAVILVFLGVWGISVSRAASYTEYHCDVKNLRLATTIEIYKDNVYFGKVEGDVFRFVTDPLTMYDTSGKRTAYAGDAYHFIAQDSHSVYVDGSFTAEMVGLVDFLGESYDIYNKAGNKVAYVSFNDWNTNGKMYDMDRNLIAEYSSNFFFNDFNVTIYDKCNLDEKTVLMIFCSYYSDQHADAAASNS